MKLSPPWRKALLTLHVVTAVGWLGVDVVLLTLGIAGARGADPEVVYPVLALVGQAVFVPLSVLAWLVGVASALLTPWGLIRHRWVLVKLVITTVMLGAVLFALRPNLVAAELGAATPPGAREGLLAAPIVSSALLLVATVLSTYKPWGRIGPSRAVPGAPISGSTVRAGRRRPAPPAADSPAPGARSGPAGRRTETAVRVPTG